MHKLRRGSVFFIKKSTTHPFLFQEYFSLSPWWITVPHRKTAPLPLRISVSLFPLLVLVSSGLRVIIVVAAVHPSLEHKFYAIVFCPPKWKTRERERLASKQGCAIPLRLCALASHTQSMTTCDLRIDAFHLAEDVLLIFILHITEVGGLLWEEFESNCANRMKICMREKWENMWTKQRRIDYDMTLPNGGEKAKLTLMSRNWTCAFIRKKEPSHHSCSVPGWWVGAAEKKSPKGKRVRDLP